MQKNIARAIILVACLGALSLTACSSSSGGGSSPSKQPNAVVLPPGAKIVCQDGNPPPCQ